MFIHLFIPCLKSDHRIRYKTWFRYRTALSFHVNVAKVRKVCRVKRISIIPSPTESMYTYNSQSVLCTCRRMYINKVVARPYIIGASGLRSFATELNSMHIFSNRTEKLSRCHRAVVTFRCGCFNGRG